MQREQVKLTNIDIVEMCPGGKSVVNRLLKEIKEEEKELFKFERFIKNLIDKKVRSPKKNELAKIFYLGLFIGEPRKKIEKQKKRLQTFKYLYENKDKKPSSRGVTQREIEIAKQYPIDQILDFNKDGYAKSLWTEERTPSMYYYKEDNRVHCFSTGKSADSIEVAMLEYGYDFLQAVKKLSGRQNV